MERFTKRDKYGHPYTDSIINDRFMWSKDGKIGERDLSQSAFDGKAIDKLCLLEDIEEESGIDLITLFNALKEGFYVKKDSINEGFVSWVKTKDIREVDIITKSITFCDYEFVYFKDYGKTWALSKEELEIEK